MKFQSLYYQIAGSRTLKLKKQLFDTRENSRAVHNNRGIIDYKTAGLLAINDFLNEKENKNIN
jgi:hypothetical protein